MNLIKSLASFTDGDRPIWHRFTKNFSVSFGGSVASICIGLARTALLTKSLVLVDYGKVLIVLNLFTFLGSFMGVRVSDMIYKFYPQFREERDIRLLKEFLLLCFALSMALSLILGVGVFLLAPWIADNFYRDGTLTSLLRIYAGAVLISAFGGVSSSILRLHDRFHCVVIPQILGGAVTLVLLGTYFFMANVYRLELVVTCFAVGVLIQTAPPLIHTIQIVHPYLRANRKGPVFGPLGKYRNEVISTLFQTNMVGYLKLVFSPGDIFLLGIFSTPAQVALYGLARQLTSPILVFQNSVQIAITPEVVTLWTKSKLEQLNRLFHQYLGSACTVGIIFTGVLFLIARPLILWLSKPEYLDSLSVFYALVVTGWFTLVYSVFYALGLMMNKIAYHNISYLISIAILVYMISLSGIDAQNLSFLQIGTQIIIGVVFCVPVMRQLMRLRKVG